MTKKNDIEAQLRRAILDADISRYRLSALSGVSDGVLSHFVNHNRSITMKTAAKLTAVLDLELTPIKRARTKG